MTDERDEQVELSAGRDDDGRDVDKWEIYEATHGRDGYRLGSARWPDNRAGRRAMRASWRGAGRRG